MMRYRIKIVLLLLIFLLLALALVFFWPQISGLAKPRLIEIKNAAAPEKNWSLADWLDSRGQGVDPINFLLLGAAGEGFEAPDLTDTILLAHYAPADQKIFLFSLPRDLLIKIPGSENYTKLNALYTINKSNKDREFDLVIQKAQEISGLTINHYVFVDLKTVRQVVDLLGGVNVLVSQDIKDNFYPGPNHSYQPFELTAGWRYLDGEMALKYIRSRHSAGGDFDRITRQQEILQAMKQKVLALDLWDFKTFFEIYQTLSTNVKTDLSLWQIKDLWQDIKEIPGSNVIKNEINNQNYLTGGQVELGGAMASILKPRAGLENYEEIKNYINNTIK